jgi:hypothetical protein
MTVMSLPLGSSSLVTSALDIALGRARPGPSLIHHSDRGTQHASFAMGLGWRDRLRLGVVGPLPQAIRGPHLGDLRRYGVGALRRPRTEAPFVDVIKSARTP